MLKLASPRSGVLSIACVIADLPGPRSGFLLRWCIPFVGKETATRPRRSQSRKLSRGHRYAVTVRLMEFCAIETRFGQYESLRRRATALFNVTTPGSITELK